MTDPDATAPPPSGSDANGDELKAAMARSRALAASLGAIVAILMRSPDHRNATLGEIEFLIGPPLAADQVAVIEARDPKSGIVSPVAAVLWAFVSDEVDARLSDVGNEKPRLEPADWRSGSIPWIIAAVGHQKAVSELLNQLVKARFAGQPPKIRVRDKDGNAKVGLVREGTVDHVNNGGGTS